MKEAQERACADKSALVYIDTLPLTMVDQSIPASWSVASRQRRDLYVLVMRKDFDQVGLGFVSDMQTVERSVQYETDSPRTSRFQRLINTREGM